MERSGSRQCLWNWKQGLRTVCLFFQCKFQPFLDNKMCRLPWESRVSVESFLILLFKFKESYYYQNLRANCSPVLEYSVLLPICLRSVESALFSIWLQSLPCSGFPLLTFSPSLEHILTFLHFQHLVEFPQTASRIPLCSSSVGNLTCKCKLS